MGKVLLISWTVPPQKTGSAIIIHNLASQFKSNEIVVAGEITNNSNGPFKLNYKVYYLNPFINYFKRGQKYSKWLNVNKITTELTDIALKEKCTSILTIFPDEFYLYVGYKVSRKLKLPFYTWFHNTYLDNRQGILRGLAYWLQPRIFSHARQNFVMSDGMKNYYKKKYPDINFESLVHPFEIPASNFQTLPNISTRVKFAFTGALNDSCLDASLRLIYTIRQNPEYEIHIFTGQKESEFIRHGIQGPNIIFHGFVPESLFLSKLSECDILLLPHGFEGNRSEVEYQTIFPTRTIPLLYANRPILAHSPENSFLTEFLKKNDCAEVIVSKDKKDIINTINQLLSSTERREEITKNALKLSRVFNAKGIADHVKKIIL